MEIKMRNLSLRIKCSFSKINSTFFCTTLFYSIFISTHLKVALKNLMMMLLVHCFNGFFCFLNWFLKVFFLNWFKNLRAQCGLYRKRVDPLDPINPNPPPQPTPCVLRLVKTFWLVETFLSECLNFK